MIRIEINSIEDLIAFVEIIKGKPVDLSSLKGLKDKLDTSTDALAEAVKDQGEITNGSTGA